MKCFHTVLFFVLTMLLQTNFSFSRNLNELEGIGLWDIFITYEDMLKYSDCIITATVQSTNNKRKTTESYDILERLTTLKIIDVIKNDGYVEAEGIITISTKEKEYNKGQIVTLNYQIPSFDLGDELLLYLCKRGGEYQLFYETYGKFTIKNGIVECCNVPIDMFKKEINKVLIGEKKKFELEYPDYYMNAIKSESSIAKTASVVTLPCSDFQFRTLFEPGFADTGKMLLVK